MTLLQHFLTPTPVTHSHSPYSLPFPFPVAVRSDISHLVSLSSPSTTPCMAFIKLHDSPLQPQYSIHSQLQVLTLSTGDSTAGEGLQSFFAQLQQLTKHLYAPMIRAAGQQQQQQQPDSSGTDGVPAALAYSSFSSNIAGSADGESIAILQKRFRELESALEQCQRGAVVPRVLLSIPPAVEKADHHTTASLLKGYLEKYNSSQVDLLFKDLGIPEVSSASAEQVEEFANEVNKSTKMWPSELARQTRLADAAFPSTAEGEIEFWKDMEKKLAETKEQLESPGVLLTKLVLKRNNRVSEQLIREAEGSLDRCAEVVQVSTSFLRDFPIDDLSAATDLHKLSRTVTSCLQHFSKLKHSRYDFSRAVRLLEVVGTAVFSRLGALLREKNLMNCSMEDLRRVKAQADEVFAAWDTQYATQRNTFKDVAKRRKETMRAVQFDNAVLQQRLGSVVEFREQHERLVGVFAVVLGGGEGEVQASVHEAYQLVVRQAGDVVDVTEGGVRAWQAARQAYEGRVERAEERLTRLLEDQLGAAQSADDMFSVFATFNPLFFRPTIRNAVNSFRAVLVKNVREDVRRLQDKFRLRYDDSLEKATADLRDIPPLGGRIIWARQIENQLGMLMRRMEDVLGIGWEDHFEGKQLKEVCDELKNYLDTEQLYREWLSVQLKSDVSRYSKMKDFLLLVEKDPRTGKRVLRVNFDDKQIVVFKEVRYLEWLLPGMSTSHKTIPSTIVKASREAYARYPTATALQAALAGFSQAKTGITAENALLLATHISAVREVVKEAMGGSQRTKRWIKWDSADLGEWVGHFSNKVYALQEKVDDVRGKTATVESLLGKLRTCAYQREVMWEVMDTLQKVVDEVQIRGFSNVPVWVVGLDHRIEQIVLARLQDAVSAWCAAFQSDCLVEVEEVADDSPRKRHTRTGLLGSGSKARRGGTGDAATVSATGSASGSGSGSGIGSAPVPETLILSPTTHEVLLSNQMLFLAPPLEQARVEWVASFHHHLSVVCTLPRLSSSRFNVFAGATVGPTDYSSTLQLFEPALLKNAFILMEEKLSLAEVYAQQWLQYQALWDASSAVLSERMGRDIVKWQQLLGEIKAARGGIDSTCEEASFGPIIINHRQVQSKVNLKYDTWQRESQVRFGAILGEEIKSTHTELLRSKAQLEGVFLEGPTNEVIGGVQCILAAQGSLTATTRLVGELESSERLLHKQRYPFPKDWVSVTNAAGALGDLRQILDRRVGAMKAQLPSLQQKIREEYQGNVARTEDLLSTWEAQRPAQGGLVAADVLHTLSVFATQVGRLVEEGGRIGSAQEALGLDRQVDDRLSFVAREVSDLREVWGLVGPVYEQLHLMRMTPVRALNSTKVRKQLDDLTEQLRGLPAKIRGYAAVEWAQEAISKRQAVQPIVRDLCTEALKDRHWRVLYHALGLTTATTTTSSTTADLTLGLLWDSNPPSYKKTIQDTLATALGEQALEQFLRDLREHWVGSELSLALRDGVRLVVGWDVLFSTLEDNLNSLASLKQVRRVW